MCPKWPVVLTSHAWLLQTWDSWSLSLSFNTEWTELPGLWLSGKSLLWSLGLYALPMTSWNVHPQSLIYSSCTIALFPSTVWWWKILDLSFTAEQWNSLWCLFVVVWMCGRDCGWWVELEESRSCTQLSYLLKSKMLAHFIIIYLFQYYFLLHYCFVFFIDTFSSGSHSAVYVCNLFLLCFRHI